MKLKFLFLSKETNESHISQMKNTSEEFFNFFSEKLTLDIECYYFAINHHLSSYIINRFISNSLFQILQSNTAILQYSVLKSILCEGIACHHKRKQKVILTEIDSGQ